MRAATASVTGAFVNFVFIAKGQAIWRETNRYPGIDTVYTACFAYEEKRPQPASAPLTAALAGCMSKAMTLPPVHAAAQTPRESRWVSRVRISVSMSVLLVPSVIHESFATSLVKAPGCVRMHTT